jgi:hypothetical protein
VNIAPEGITRVLVVAILTTQARLSSQHLSSIALIAAQGQVAVGVEFVKTSS